MQGLDTLLLAFLAMLSWGVGDFLIHRSSRKFGSIEALAAIGIVGSVILAPFAFRDVPLWGIGAFVLACLGFVTFMTAVLNFEAFRAGKLGVIDVILTLELPVTILLAISIFGERLSLPEWGLVCAIFAGIVLISVEDFSDLRWEHGAFLALIAAILYGFINFFTAAASMSISPMAAIWVPWLFITVCSVMWMARQGDLRKFSRNMIGSWKLVLAMGVIDTLAWLFYAFAVEGGDVAITTAITESYPVIAIALGVAINRERLVRHQYAGALLALAGSVLLALLTG